MSNPSDYSGIFTPSLVIKRGEIIAEDIGKKIEAFPPIDIDLPVGTSFSLNYTKTKILESSTDIMEKILDYKAIAEATRGGFITGMRRNYKAVKPDFDANTNMLLPNTNAPGVAYKITIALAGLYNIKDQLLDDIDEIFNSGIKEGLPLSKLESLAKDATKSTYNTEMAKLSAKVPKSYFDVAKNQASKGKF